MRRKASLSVAVLLLSMIAPSATAADSGGTTITRSSTYELLADRSNCSHRGEPDCVTAFVQVSYDPKLDGGRLCAGVGDEAYPPLVPFAAGCTPVDSSDLTFTGLKGVVVPTFDLIANDSTDCFMQQIPEECVPDTVVVSLAAAFSAVSKPVAFRETGPPYTVYPVAGGLPCTATDTVKGRRVQIEGVLTWAGAEYVFPSPEQDRGTVTLSYQRTTTKTVC